MSEFGVAAAVVLGVLGVLGIAVTAWVFWPAFKGPEAARQAIGTHRLALGAIVSVVVMNAVITLPIASLLHIDKGFTVSTFIVAALSTEIPMLVFIYVRLILPGAVSWTELGLRPLRWDYLLRMGLGAGLAGLIVVDVIGALLSQVGLRSNQL